MIAFNGTSVFNSIIYCEIIWKIINRLRSWNYLSDKICGILVSGKIVAIWHSTFTKRQSKIEETEKEKKREQTGNVPCEMSGIKCFPCESSENMFIDSTYTLQKRIYSNNIRFTNKSNRIFT